MNIILLNLNIIGQVVTTVGNGWESSGTPGKIRITIIHLGQTSQIIVNIILMALKITWQVVAEHMIK